MRLEEQEEKKARARTEEAPEKEAADDAPPSSQPEGAPSSRDAAGRDIPTKCGATGCGVENDKDAKFCKGCGASMSTGAADGPPVESEDEPAKSDPMPPKPGASARSVGASASFAEILGLRSDASLPAQKAAALGWRRVMVKAAAMTDYQVTQPDEIVGALLLVEKDAADAPRLRGERNALRAKNETDERMALAHRLVAAGEDRARVFVDVVGAGGKRTGIKLADEVSELRIKTLRAKVEGLEARKAPANPFEPDRARAAALAGDVARTGGLDKASRIKAAEKDPTVIKMYENEKIQGGKVTLADVAAQWIETLDGGAK